MLQSFLIDPIASVTCQNSGFPTKISAKNFQRVKKQNIFDIIPLEMCPNRVYWS